MKRNYSWILRALFLGRMRFNTTPNLLEKKAIYITMRSNSFIPKPNSVKKLFMLLVATTLLSQTFFAQVGSNLSKAEFEGYQQKRLKETAEEHRMLKTY